MHTDGASVPQTLRAYFRNPIREIAHLPSWSLRKSLLVQGGLAAISGALRALVSPGLWRLLQGVIIFPLLVTVTSTLLACFFFYYFELFEHRRVRLDRLVTLVAFSNFIFFITHIVSHLFPPADLIGLAVTAALLVVGLSENFQLPKNRSLRLIGVVFGLLFALWLTERIASNSSAEPDDAPTSDSAPL